MIEQLLSQYSIETLIILIALLGFSIKAMSELWEWFYNKFKEHFSFRTQRDQDHQQLIEEIKELSSDIKATKAEVHQLENNMSQFSDQMKITTERLQENARNYIIDKHHYFCYQVKTIDDLSLQSLERRFLYYKAAGGNSFIDGLMEEIRELPRLNFQNEQLLEDISKRERGKM